MKASEEHTPAPNAEERHHNWVGEVGRHKREVLPPSPPTAERMVNVDHALHERRLKQQLLHALRRQAAAQLLRQPRQLELFALEQLLKDRLWLIRRDAWGESARTNEAVWSLASLPDTPSQSMPRADEAYFSRQTARSACHVSGQ